MTMNKFLDECRRYMQNGGILAGSLFNTVEIPSHKMTEAGRSDAQKYLESNRELFFTEQLFTMIDRTGRRDSEIYKKARIDRRLFSKIRSNKKYIPSKKTVLALCLALELPRDQADLLLACAGYSLSRADDFDLLIAFCMEKNIFNFFEIDEMLDHFGLETF